MNSKKMSNHFFPESEAAIFVEEMFGMWPKKIAHRIFWLSFQALQKSGFTYFENDEEEMLVRERIRMIGVLYYEFCHQSAAHESENFSHWSPVLCEQIRKEFNAESDDCMWEVKEALTEYLSHGDELLGVNVVREMWLNCEEGRRNVIIPIGRVVFPTSEDPNYEQARTWWIGGHMSVESLECI